MSDLIAFAERLADAARAQTLPRFRSCQAVENKADRGFDPVTEADRGAELAIRTLIQAEYPEHGIIGEEFGNERATAEWRWVLDPIDGTRAFVSGATTWTTLIALEHQAVPVIGIIDQAFTDERWIGQAGASHYQRNGRSRVCKTSTVAALSEARIATTDPRTDGYFSVDEATAFAALAQQCRLARFSLDAYAYALLAMGQIDLVVESGLKHYDHAALAPVVEGAGGIISDWRGNAPGRCPRGRIIAAATPALHAAAMKHLRHLV